MGPWCGTLVWDPVFFYNTLGVLVVLVVLVVCVLVHTLGGSGGVHMGFVPVMQIRDPIL